MGGAAIDLLPRAAADPGDPLAGVHGRAIAFSLLALSPLFHAFNCRSATASIFTLRRSCPLALVGAVVVSAAIHLTAVLVPGAAAGLPDVLDERLRVDRFCSCSRRRSSRPSRSSSSAIASSDENHAKSRTGRRQRPDSLAIVAGMRSFCSRSGSPSRWPPRAEGARRRPAGAGEERRRATRIRAFTDYAAIARDPRPSTAAAATRPR